MSRVFFKQLSTYTLLNAFNKVFPFLLLPILSRLFSESDLGYYTLYQSITTLLIPILTISSINAIIVNYFHIEKNNYAEYLSNIIIFVFFYSLIVFGFIYLFQHKIADFLSFTKQGVILSSLIVFPDFLVQARAAIYRNENKPFKYGSISISSSLLTNALGLIFAFGFNLSWLGVLVGILVGQIIVAIYSLYTFRVEKLIRLKLNFSYIKDALRISGPIAFHQIGAWFTNSYSKVVVNIVLGVAATGQLGIGSVFGMIMTFIQDSFNLAFTPYLFSKLKENTMASKEQIFKITVLAYLTIILVAFSLSIIGVLFVGYIFGNQYIGTKQFLIPLVISAVINGMYKLHVNYLFYFKKTMYIAMVTILGGLLSIPASYFSTLKFGIIGLCYSMVLIQLLIYLSILILANKTYNMNWALQFKTLFSKKE